MRACTVIIGLVLAAVWTSSVRAQTDKQPWLGDRRFEGGMGIRTGNLELHPGVAGEVGYDSNFFQASGTTSSGNQLIEIPVEYRPVLPDGTTFGETGVINEPTVGTFRFRITPSLTLTTLSQQRKEGDSDQAEPPKVDLKVALSASYNELISIDPEYSEEVSDNRFLEGDVSISADILPRRPWGIGFIGQYNRSVQPVNDPAAPPEFQRSTFRGGGALKWRPGSGLLDWSLGYDLTYTLFEDELFSTFSNLAHSFSLKGRWLFLPRTALLYSGDYGYIQYPDGGEVKPPGAALSSVLGINGLVTRSMSALALVGWKTLFFSSGDEFDSLVGNAELTWYVLARPDLEPEAAGVGLSSISAGYRRDARASYLGNYYQVDSGYLKASYFFGGTVLTTVDLSFDHLTRARSLFSNGTQQSPEFTDNRINATGFAEYRTSDTFGINATIRFTSSLTDQLIAVESDPGVARLPYDELGFDRLETWLGVRWFL